MRTSDLLTLYDYNYWATRRVLDTAARVPEEQYHAPADISHHSLHRTLVHTYDAETTWRLRCEASISPGELRRDELPTLEKLAERWREEEAAMRAYLRSLTDEDLDRVIDYKRTDGTPRENVLWHILTHVVNHGTQHRSEAAVLLTQYGYSPGDLDFILYLRLQQP